MEFLSNKPLLVTDTILRDAHQSQAATRMRLEDMIPACEILDSIGYYSVECWGGATFDSCMRFLNEDPWERLRAIRKAMPNTKLQMLFRGQNILGYKHYADDVVDAFCAKSIENGIDIIRIFDALNDIRNLEQAIKSTKKYGGEVEATLSYTISPIHSEEYFVKMAKELEQMGADAICIKDMANLLLPLDAYSLVKKLKETVKVPIHLHTHNTTGTGDMVYLMAAYAGVDIVDCALSPLANGTAQPATEALVATLKGSARDTGLDLGKMSDAAVHFRKVAEKLKAEGSVDDVDTGHCGHQIDHVAGTGGVVGVQVDGHIHVLLQTLDQRVSVHGQQQVSHVLDAQGVGAHLLQLLGHLHEVILVVDGGDGVGEGSLDDTAVLLGGLDGLLQVAHVVQSVENTDDVNAVFDGLAAESVHHVVGVVLVAQNVLAAEEHLQLGVGQSGLQLAQTLPGIFVQETHAAVEGSAAPALQRVVADGVQDLAGGEHILHAHTGGGLRLVGVTQDGVGDQQGFVGQKFHNCLLLAPGRAPAGKYLEILI